MREERDFESWLRELVDGLEAEKDVCALATKLAQVIRDKAPDLDCSEILSMFQQLPDLIRLKRATLIGQSLSEVYRLLANACAHRMYVVEALRDGHVQDLFLDMSLAKVDEVNNLSHLFFNYYLTLSDQIVHLEQSKENVPDAMYMSQKVFDHLWMILANASSVQEQDLIKPYDNTLFSQLENITYILRSTVTEKCWSNTTVTAAQFLAGVHHPVVLLKDRLSDDVAADVIASCHYIRISVILGDRLDWSTELVGVACLKTTFDVLVNVLQQELKTATEWSDACNAMLLYLNQLMNNAELGQRMLDTCTTLDVDFKQVVWLLINTPIAFDKDVLDLAREVSIRLAIALKLDMSDVGSYTEEVFALLDKTKVAKVLWQVLGYIRLRVAEEQRLLPSNIVKLCKMLGQEFNSVQHLQTDVIQLLMDLLNHRDIMNESVLLIVNTADDLYNHNTKATYNAARLWLAAVASAQHRDIKVNMSLAQDRVSLVLQGALVVDKTSAKGVEMALNVMQHLDDVVKRDILTRPIAVISKPEQDTGVASITIAHRLKQLLDEEQPQAFRDLIRRNTSTIDLDE